VKLTAPPRPQEHPGSGQQTPDDPIASPGTPSDDTFAPPATPKNVVWPGWFAGADFILVMLVLALAFLVSSYVARNPDLWRHLAAGKRLMTGEYKPGEDPFSYSATDRVWVNHSLLFDALSYELYIGDGALLVVAKALAIVCTFGLLISIRRPGSPLWPWAAVGGIAVLAAAPRFNLAPLIGSIFLLAVTLFLLFRFQHRRHSWRFPLAIGLTFWVWAQVDSWFLLGPLVLILVLLGEFIQTQFLSNRAVEDPTTGSEPLGGFPDVANLVKALAIGVLACMLNPHHIRIWELPFELMGAPGSKADGRILAMTLSPTDKLYFQRVSGGMNLNGFAYWLLFVGGATVLSFGVAFGVGRIRISHLALWTGFALLSICRIFAIPFFAVVAVPLIATQLNAFSSVFKLRNWDEPKTKFLLLGSAVGRVLCLVLVASACILSWPGWMQPENPNPAFNRRVGWSIEPDPGLVRAAQQLQSWRESGRLAPDKRGMVASIELADYCAWFAPLEKVYVNGNYNHHGKELASYFAIRTDLGFSTEPQNAKETGAQLDKLGAEYLVLASVQIDSPPVRRRPIEYSIGLWMDSDEWAPWYFDGRSAISGWRRSRESKQKDFTDMRIDPVVLAFGPDVARLPATSVKPIPPVEGWAGEFIHGIESCPPGVEEAIGWQLYRGIIHQRYEHTEVISGMMRGLSFSPSPGGFTHFQLINQLSMYTLNSVMRRPPESLDAIPFLSLRAARRAIAADPDNPDCYFALFQALVSPELPISESERTIGQVTALRQCLFRMPPPNQYQRNIYHTPPHQVARFLSQFYYGQAHNIQRVRTTWPIGLPIDLPALNILGDSSFSDGVTGVAEINRRLSPIRWRERNQYPHVIGKPNIRAVDLSRDMLLLAIEYAEVELTRENREYLEKELEDMKTRAKSLSEELVKSTQSFESEKLRQTKLPDQVRSALRHNLVGKALEILTEKGLDLQKEYGQNVVEIVLIRIALEMVIGRLEDAAVDLEYAPKVLDSARPHQNVRQILQNNIKNMEYQKLVFEGNYQEAGELVGSMVGDQIGKDPPLSQKEAAFKQSSALVTLGLDRTFQTFQLMPTNPLVFLGRDVMLLDVLQPFSQRQQMLIRSRNTASSFFYQRGLLSLFEGDIPSAKKRFEQCRQPKVPEWGVPEISNSKAEHYLKLIDEAEKRAAK
jgi:hypothetical protein